MLQPCSGFLIEPGKLNAHAEPGIAGSNRALARETHIRIPEAGEKDGSYRSSSHGLQIAPIAADVRLRSEKKDDNRSADLRGTQSRCRLNCVTEGSEILRQSIGDGRLRQWVLSADHGYCSCRNRLSSPASSMRICVSRASAQFEPAIPGSAWALSLPGSIRKPEHGCSIGLK